VIFAWLAVIFVVIWVACASLALTATSIRADQSIELVVFVPDVEIVLVEPDDVDDDDPVVPEVVLLTVMTGTCQKEPGRHDAGPANR
jgi:hypothetical protein